MATVLRELADGSIIEEEVVEQRPPDNVVADMVRSERNARLRHEVDTIAGNILRWASLTAEQQAAWAKYRQDLLDITTQSGFPHTIVWPTKPAQG